MKRIIPAIIILAAIGGGYWWLNQPGPATLEAASVSTNLVGSGTIEAETVAITAELGGRIVELKVGEGNEVKAGQVLVELDKADLLAQQIQLEAALTNAQANLEFVSALARSEDIAVAQAKLGQAQVAADGALQTWQETQKLVNNPHDLEAKVNQAQAQVTEAERNLELAQVNLKRMDIQAEAASRNQSSHEALVQNDAAHYQLQAAQIGVDMADVALTGAKKQVEDWSKIRDNPIQLLTRAKATEVDYNRAEAAVLVAEANLNVVRADPTAEDIAVAQAQIQEAKAALAAVEVQLAKQTLTAPRDGLITQKLVNPGELATPGALLLELSDIDTVKLTVYIPETRIGQVQVGQEAQVYVDAYENEPFEGVVSFIAHEAEFTPKNVQTQEERVNLVFAVKITLDNADHRLKPGMPADAEILPTTVASFTEMSTPTLSSQQALIPTAQPSLTKTSTPTPISASPQATFTPTPEPTKFAPTAQAEVVTWWLNVRSGPGANYPIVTTLPQGDVVPIIKMDPDTGWLQVKLSGDGTVGWISGSPNYVTISGNIDNK